MMRLNRKERNFKTIIFESVKKNRIWFKSIKTKMIKFKLYCRRKKEKRSKAASSKHKVVEFSFAREVAEDDGIDPQMFSIGVLKTKTI